MRTFLAPVMLVSFALVGCVDRQNMRVVPDRKGHAASTEEQGAPIGNRPQAFAGEQYYTMTANDTLSSVAKKFGTTVDWLIKRNDIQEFKGAGAGANLIVPSTPTAKPASRPAAKPAPASNPRPR